MTRTRISPKGRFPRAFEQVTGERDEIARPLRTLSWRVSARFLPAPDLDVDPLLVELGLEVGERAVGRVHQVGTSFWKAGPGRSPGWPGQPDPGQDAEEAEVHGAHREAAREAHRPLSEGLLHQLDQWVEDQRDDRRNEEDEDDGLAARASA